MDLEKTIKNLKLRGFSVKYFETGKDAVNYLKSSIENTSVGIGGSMTAQQLDLYSVLSEKNDVVFRWKTPDYESTNKANAAPIYISSANAITEDGEIINIDGSGNRLAGQVYGKKKVYIVAGVNKICPDFESGLYRARNIAAVKNCKRFENNNPCKIDDKCHDCRSINRICRALLVLWAPMRDMEVEVVLINEELGF